MRIVEPTVRARTLEIFALLVRELGGDATRILTRVGITEDATARPLEWISFPAVLRAYEMAAAETRCRTFRLRLAAEELQGACEGARMMNRRDFSFALAAGAVA